MSDSNRQRERVLLTDPDDSKWLTDLLCYLRLQLEFFTADADDVEVRRRKGGMKEPIFLGRVGIRCIHCAHVPALDRTNGAVTYPKSIALVHQAVRNWQRYHLNSCPCIPNEMREKIGGFGKKRRHSGSLSLRHWVASCEGKGLVDADDGEHEGRIGIVVLEGSDSPLLLSGGDAGGGAAEQAALQQRQDGCADAAAAAGEGTSSAAAAGGRVGEGAAAAAIRDPGVAEAMVSDGGTSGLLLGGALLHTEADATAMINVACADVQGGQKTTGGETDVANSASLMTGDLIGGGGESWATKPTFAASSSSGTFSLDGFELDLLGGEGAEDLLEGEKIDDDENQNGIGTPLKFGEVEELGSSGVDTSLIYAAVAAPPPITNAIPSERLEQILEKTRLAHGIVKTTREMLLIPEAAPASVVSSAARQIEPSSRDDLYSLGVELYELFVGCRPLLANATPKGGTHEADPSDDYRGVETRKKREKRMPDEGSYTPLKELGFPVSLSDLVSSLLGMSSDDEESTNNSSVRSYKSTDEVEEDLRQMMLNPDRFLFDVGIDLLTGELDFSHKKLYGREVEVSMLMDAYERVIGMRGTCEMVLVAGYSGTGKSSLVLRVRDPITEKGGFFISGKFDKLQQVQPFSAIVAAFNGFCDMLLARDADSLDEIKAAIKAAVGSDGKVLTDLIPNLKMVIGESHDSKCEIRGKESQNRLGFFFRAFLRAISSPMHPVVLSLDDLQWADEASLELIRMTVTDPDMSSLLVLGCYRDNEIGDDHPLASNLKNVASSGVNVTEIDVNNIGREHVNELISDTLHLSPRQTQPLADLVYNKTSGNALFVVQFLISLHDEGLLRFSLATRRWIWDVEAIQQKNISDNVVELMTSKMRKLAPEVLWSLNMAACFGSQCDESTLKLLDANSDTEQQGISHHLDVAVREGLMCKVGLIYKFTHDQIQSAAYSLIPGTGKDVLAFHLLIGRVLWKGALAEELDRILFVVVDQLHRGSTLMTDQEERNGLAKLCLMAGKKAVASSSYLTASIYLLQGMELLNTKHWEEDYDLSLELFTCCAEANYVTGNLDEVSLIVKPILLHSRSLHDRLRAYYALISASGAQGKGKQLDAIKYGLDVLAQLGESFPSEPNQNDIMEDFVKTQAMIGEPTIDGILHKDQMEDKDKLSGMHFLNLLSAYAFQANQQLSPLITFRMVQLSLCHGPCRESSFAFASFGVVFIQFGDMEQGYRYAKLALALLERFSAKEYLARVYAVVYGFINIFAQPIQAILPSLKHAYGVGLETGHFDWALDNAGLYVQTAFQCGFNLEALLPEARTFSQQMKDQNYLGVNALTLPYLQAILNLIRDPEDPTLLSGEAMDQDYLLNEATEAENPPGAEGVVYFVRMLLAYLFRRYNLAAEMVRLRQDWCKKRPWRGGTIVQETFYTGLIAIAVVNSQGSDDSGWKTMAYDAREKMKGWARDSTWNYQHKVHLLNAEIAYLDGDMDGAAKAYDDAIRSAGEHGFVHEQALACERAAIFYSNSPFPIMAMDYWKQAHKHYLEWGARSKANDVSKRLIDSA